MDVAGNAVTFFAVQSSEASCDVFADAFNLGEFGGAAGGGLGISEGAEFFFEFFDVSSKSLGVLLSDSLVDLLFHHD